MCLLLMEFSFWCPLICSVPEHSMRYTVSDVFNQISLGTFHLLGILVGHGIGFFNRNLEQFTVECK